MHGNIAVHPKSYPQDAKYAFGHEAYDYDKLWANFIYTFHDVFFLYNTKL